MIFAEAAALFDAVDVAVTVTLPAAPGAVNDVALPLAVCVGLKLPHEPAGVQLQSTPPFVLSLATFAVIEAVPFTFNEAGAPLSVTLTPEDEPIVIVAVAACAGAAVGAALIVTVPAVVGAVYVVDAPLAVCVGLKLPHAPAGVQLQSTPAFVLSFETVALSETVPPVARFAGAPVIVALAIGGGLLFELLPPPQPIVKSSASAAPPHTPILYLIEPSFVLRVSTSLGLASPVRNQTIDPKILSARNSSAGWGKRCR